MAKKVKSFRLDVDLIGWVDSYAAERDSTQAAVVEEALHHFKGLCEGGVADLPSPTSGDWERGVSEVSEASPAPVEVLGAALAAGRVEYARNIADRQARLNAAALRSRAPQPGRGRS